MLECIWEAEKEQEAAREMRIAEVSLKVILLHWKSGNRGEIKQSRSPLIIPMRSLSRTCEKFWSELGQELTMAMSAAAVRLPQLHTVLFWLSRKSVFSNAIYCSAYDFCTDTIAQEGNDSDTINLNRAQKADLWDTTAWFWDSYAILSTIPGIVQCLNMKRDVGIGNSIFQILNFTEFKSSAHSVRTFLVRYVLERTKWNLATATNVTWLQSPTLSAICTKSPLWELLCGNISDISATGSQ
jgi:hypothetical protein